MKNQNKIMKQTLKNLFSRKKSEDKPIIEEKYFVKYRDLINQETFIRLLDEYKSQRIVYEPVRNKLTQVEQEELYMQIDNSDFFSPQEKFETVIGLMMVLDGSCPEPRILSYLKKVFGKEFVETIEKKKEKFKESQEVILLKDRDWSVIDGEICRVLEFTPLAAVVKDGQVKASGLTLPYASVVIECPRIQGRATGYITHKIDFAMLWAAFNERTQVKAARAEVQYNQHGDPAFVSKYDAASNEEVWLVWTRKHYRLKFGLINKPFPRLIVMVSPKGAYELLTNPNEKPELIGEARFLAERPLVTWKPKVMRK